MKARYEVVQSDLVEFFHEMILDFGHKETGKYLDSKNVELSVSIKVCIYALYATIIKRKSSYRFMLPYLKGVRSDDVVDTIKSTFVSSVQGHMWIGSNKTSPLYTGSERAVATVNGTAALHIALKLAGVEAEI